MIWDHAVLVQIQVDRLHLWSHRLMDGHRRDMPEVRDRDPLRSLKDANSNFISTFLLRIASWNASCFFCLSSKDGLCAGLKILRFPIVTEGRHEYLEIQTAIFIGLINPGLQVRVLPVRKFLTIAQSVEQVKMYLVCSIGVAVNIFCPQSRCPRFKPGMELYGPIY